MTAHRARLGMWVFLASELLLFGGLFALYAAARVHQPAAFREAAHHSEKLLGSLNTAILLASSTALAASLECLREEKRARARALLLGTIALGAVFLAVKLVEWTHHVHQGQLPTTGGPWTLYFTMTGLHAVHVIVGLAVLSYLAIGMDEVRLTNGALYWHFVDVVWLFLWPMFYLA